MPAGNFSTSVVKGETLALSFALTDEDGVAINLTGATAAMALRTSLTASSVALSCTPYLSIPTPANGVIVLSAPTDSLTVGRYVYDLKVTDSQSVVKVYLAGTIDVTQGVTP